MDGSLVTRLHTNRGLSLAEVMVSTGMLAVAALSLLTVFIGGLRLMQRSNEMAAANDVAKSVLEAVKRDVGAHGMSAVPSGALTYDGRIPDSEDLTTPEPFPPDPYPAITVNDTDYRIVVSSANEGTRVKRVKVMVYWDDNTPLILETLIHP